MDLRKTGCPGDQAFHSHHPSASATWVRSSSECTLPFLFYKDTNSVYFTLVFDIPQWNRSSSCGSTCTKLAACLLLTARGCPIPSRESSSRRRARSQRWAHQIWSCLQLFLHPFETCRFPLRCCQRRCVRLGTSCWFLRTWSCLGRPVNWETTLLLLSLNFTIKTQWWDRDTVHSQINNSFPAVSFYITTGSITDFINIFFL